MSQEKVLYEVAVNKRFRLFLRTEHLLTTLLQSQKESSPAHSRMQLWSLCELFNLLDKSPLLVELSKELSSHESSLNKLLDTPCVDVERLSMILEEIARAQKFLKVVEEPLTALMRNHYFLAQTRQYGLGCFLGFQEDQPAITAWLNADSQHQQATFAHWMDLVQPVMKALTLILQLSRQSSAATTQHAQAGRYQKSLQNQAYQLIRVACPKGLNLYPSIHVSRHLLNIRFYQAHFKDGIRDEPYRQDVDFELTLCDM